MAQRTDSGFPDCHGLSGRSIVISQPEEAWPIPSGASDRKRYFGQTWVGGAVPSEAVRHHGHPMHVAVPFPAEHRAGPEFVRALVRLCRPWMPAPAKLIDRADAGSRHPDRQAARPEADRRGPGTADVGAGGTGLSCRALTPSVLSNPRHRNRASARSRCRRKRVRRFRCDFDAGHGVRSFAVRPEQRSGPRRGYTIDPPSVDQR